jgi:hypothetical protein
MPAQTLSRKEPYELVWSKPMTKLAPKSRSRFDDDHSEEQRFGKSNPLALTATTSCVKP